MGKIKLVISALHTKTGGGLTYINGLLKEIQDVPGLEITVLRDKRHARPIHEYTSVRYIDIPCPKSGMLTTIWEQFIVPFYSYKYWADHTLFNANYCAFFAKKPSIILHTDASVIDLIPIRKQRLYWHGLKWLTKLSIIRAQHIFSVSESVSHYWIDPTSSHKKKVKIIYAGLIFDRIKIEAPYDRTNLNLVTLGDFYPQKNYPFLAEVMKHVAQAEPTVKLHIIGAVHDGEVSKKFFKKVAEYGLQNKVLFHGRKPHKEALSYLRHADVYISASLVEALNLPLVEAQLLSIPIVASDIRTHREVLSSSLHLMPVHDEADAALFAKEILLTKGTMPKQKNPLLDEFSWQKVADKILRKLC